MPSPKPLQPGVFYHVFNRGNNGENLFRTEEHYRYFLKLYGKYIEPAASTYAYCLMGNHFHLLVYVYSPEEQAQAAARLVPGETYKFTCASQAFSNLFNAYSKAINKAYGRTGSLFEHPFHRIPIRSDSHFTRLISYIHENPEKHGFVQDFRDWPYSSYSVLLSDRPTRLKREQVLEWFGGAERLRRPYAARAIEDEYQYLLADIP